MTIEELRDYLNDLIESGQKDKEVVIKYYDTDYDLDRYECIGSVNLEKSMSLEKDVVTIEGNLDLI